MKTVLIKLAWVLAIGLMSIQTLSLSGGKMLSQAKVAEQEGRSAPKASIMSNFSSPAHWQRVITFGHQHNVSRVVYWGGPRDIFLYPKYPKLLPDGAQAEVIESRKRLRQVAEMATKAGMEFWCAIQVLQLPPVTVKPPRPGGQAWYYVLERPDVSHVRKVLPKLFNQYDEPDMGGDVVRKLIGDQLDELFLLAPELKGIELWVMEGGGVQIAWLAHQQLSMEEICTRIVDTVYDRVVAKGLKLDVDLHTGGGDPVTRQGLMRAAMRHPQIIVSADDVIGDFHPFLPFHEGLIEASKTNPIAIHFDLHGEYWGRNLVPTSALNQYAEHIEIARKLGAVYLDARLTCGADGFTPHANVLPSRRRLYPALAKTSDAKPLPGNLEIPVIDTLGAFNAEFFLQRLKDPKAKPEDTVRDFLRQEFGEQAVALVPTFLKLEEALGKMFFADKNYYGFQSVLPDPPTMELAYLSTQMTLSAGTELPTPEMRKEIAAKEGFKIPFAGWPTPVGHRCAGPEAMIREKLEALTTAEEMLREVQNGTQGLRPSDRDFLVRQFEDLVYVAKARRFLLEAQVNYYLIKDGKKAGDLPDPARLKLALGEVRKVAKGWEARYPGGRYGIAETLRQWLKTMGPQ